LTSSSQGDRSNFGLIGVRQGSGQIHAAFLKNEHVRLIAPLDDFWADAEYLVSHPSKWDEQSVDVTLLTVTPPIPSDARIFCVGLNYREHVSEGIFETPENPALFGRWTRTLTSSPSSIAVPANEEGLDWEGEVAAVVGERISRADPDTARASVFGYAAFNDMTARRAQRLSHQWTLGKNLDGSGPLGPIVPREQVGDLRSGLTLETRVNGQTVQHGSTGDQIFEVGVVLSLISQSVDLQPGDILATGTPSGVGYARTPPWLLHPGDVVEVEIEKLGLIRTTIYPPPLGERTIRGDH
jgi:2-keto-4-pentenoate hydratase/2-oxohepta-3-ene-1,7-dioic acid hydratase in catechol pathway